MNYPAVSVDSYLLAVINQHAASIGETRALEMRQAFFDALKLESFGRYLEDVIPSGSHAKGTAIKGKSDLDLFLSFAQNCPLSLSDLYAGVLSFAERYKLNPSEQRVSIGISYQGLSIDLVPGHRQNAYTSDHSIHLVSGGDWLKTNIEKQIQFVRQANRAAEIRAFKIWKEQKSLDFPSCLAELVVIEALKSTTDLSIAKRCNVVLAFLQNEFQWRTFPDPGKQSHDIGEDIGNDAKQAIKRAASAIRNWSEFIS